MEKERLIIELGFEGNRIKLKTDLEEIPVQIAEEIINQVHHITIEKCADEVLDKNLKEQIDKDMREVGEQLHEQHKAITFWKVTSTVLAILLLAIMFVK